MAKARKSRKSAVSTASKGVKSRPAPTDNAGGALMGGLGLSDLRQLIRLVQRTGIGELEVTEGGRSVRISAHAAHSAPVAYAAPVPMAAPVAEPKAGASGATSPAAPPTNERLVAITSPMVGTFYRAPAPDADPYVDRGDVVDVGQTVCIVEAMKLMNTIESEVKGRVVEILVENAQPVEFGQKLFLVDPA